MAIKVKVNIHPDVLAKLRDLEPPSEVVDRIVADVMRGIVADGLHVPHKYGGPATWREHLKPGWKIDS